MGGATLRALAGAVVALGYLATLQAVAVPESHTLRERPTDYRLAADVVSFPSLDGIALNGWWIPAQRGAARPTDQSAVRGTVILAHGRDANRSFMLSRARFLVESGYNAFPIDLRGSGESGGRYVTPGNLEALDILGAVEAARRRGARGPFVALGHSSGAVASLQAAARSPEIAAVIADGAFISVDQVLERATEVVGRDPQAAVWQKLELRTASRFMRSSWGRGFLTWVFYVRMGVQMDPHDADALPAIARVGERPVLFIAGERDAIATPEDARRMYDAAASPAKGFLVVPGAGHNSTDAAAPRLYETTVLRFLGAALGPPPKARGH